MRASIRLLTIPALIIGVLIVLSMFFVKPWFEDVLEKRKMIDVREAEVSLLLNKSEKLVALDEEQLRQYLVELELAIPSEVSAPYVLAALEQLVQAQGMTVDSIQFVGVSNVTAEQQSVLLNTAEGGSGAPPVPPQELDPEALISSAVAKSGQIDVQLSARGEYHQIINFFRNLGQSRPVMGGTEFTTQQIESVQAGVDGDGNTSASLVLNFEVNASFQEIPADLGAATTGVVSLRPQDVETIEQVATFAPLLQIRSGTDGDSGEPGLSVGRENPF